MSLIATYHEKKRILDKLTRDLHELEKDRDVKNASLASDQLNKVIAENNISAHDAILLIDPDGEAVREIARKEAEMKGTRRKYSKRKVVTYKNPHTGEVVENKGGPNKALAVWRDKYGKEVVESWIIETSAP